MHNHVYPEGINRSRQQGFFGNLWGGQQGQSANLSLAAELNRSGFTAVCAAYELDFTPISKPGDARENYLRWIDALDRQLEKEHLQRALTLKDLQAAHASKRPTVIQAIEGAQFIEGRLERIEEVYKRGLRHLQLLHDRDDLVVRLGDTDNGRDHTGGLSAFGRDVVRECNRLGIVVDLAHASPETIAGASKVTSQPFIVSHSGPDKPSTGNSRMMGMLQTRLLNKERAKVVADAGGVIGVWIYMADSVQDYVRNLRAMVEIAGIDHVGIGTDTNIISGASGQHTNQAWPGLNGGFFYSTVAEMLRQGFTPEEIRKVGGGNYCRVFDKVTQARADKRGPTV